MFLRSATENTGTVLFCNPNAGFYEYLYVQNEWISMYYELGLNVFIWNYRGYGRSEGSPDIKRLRIDGEIIVHYMRSQLKLGKIAVHGESLGGCIACYLAKRTNLDFLFADRSPASIQDVGFFKFGKFGYWALKVFLNNDCDAVDDFLGTRCYKVISADPNDAIIGDIASLKSGVALRFVYPNYSVLTLAYYEPKLLQTASHLLRPAEICNLVSALKKILKIEKNSEEMTEIVNKLENIDAGGKGLCEVINDKHLNVTALLWIITADLWGSMTYSQDTLSPYMKTIDKINSALEEIDLHSEEFGKQDDLQVIKENLIVLNKRLEEKCGIHGNIEEFEKVNRIVDFAVVGRLLPVNCGHCGCFNYLEKTGYVRHLQAFLDTL